MHFFNVWLVLVVIVIDTSFVFFVFFFAATLRLSVNQSNGTATYSSPNSTGTTRSKFGSSEFIFAVISSCLCAVMRQLCVVFVNVFVLLFRIFGRGVQTQGIFYSNIKLNNDWFILSLCLLGWYGCTRELAKQLSVTLAYPVPSNFWSFKFE